MLDVYSWSDQLPSKEEYLVPILAVFQRKLESDEVEYYVGYFTDWEGEACFVGEHVRWCLSSCVKFRWTELPVDIVL